MNSRLAEISTRLRIGAGVSVAAAALICSVALTPPAAARASGPGVVISPLPETPDADPHTQISFLGAPASELRDVVVEGSRSGSHAGQLRSRTSSSGTGGRFSAAQAFTGGGRVTVPALVVGPGRATRIGI